MKYSIFASSDWHGDWTTAGVRRFQEIKEGALAWADDAIESGADVAVFLGDLCNPDAGSCTFRVVGLIAEVALKLRARGVSFIALAGNHDVIEDGSGETSLTPLRALEDLEVGIYGATSGIARPMGSIYIVEHPSAIEIPSRWGGSERIIRFVCLPFTATSHGYDVTAAIHDLAGEHAKEDLVVLSHLSLPGLEGDEAVTEMGRGREVVLPAALAIERSALVLQGHYHRKHRTKEGIWVAGSLARLTFAPGIESHRPGYLTVNV